jgi:hypothetical protein
MQLFQNKKLKSYAEGREIEGLWSKAGPGKKYETLSEK